MKKLIVATALLAVLATPALAQRKSYSAMSDEEKVQQKVRDSVDAQYRNTVDRTSKDTAAVQVDRLGVRAVEVDLGLAARRAERAVHADALAGERERHARAGPGRVADRVTGVRRVPGRLPRPAVLGELVRDAAAHPRAGAAPVPQVQLPQAQGRQAAEGCRRRAA